MPEIQSIAAYLRQMQFKRKAFGGCDEESVLDHISQITLQYEAVVSALLLSTEQSARQIAALQAQLEQYRQAQADQAQAIWYPPAPQGPVYPAWPAQGGYYG